MSVCIVFAALIIVSSGLVNAAAARSDIRGAVPHEIATMFGARAVSPHTVQQSKRDLSLSYAATNIDSKEGTRVKTITVIKNHDGKSSGKLAINPELHKSEEWAKAFRDNFDSYGTIPDVPDIDDLFEFMNKKNQPKESKDQEKHTTNAPKPDKPGEAAEKPVSEASAEVKDPTATTPSDEAVEKIKGDAEVIGSGSKRHSNFRSQSISVEKQRLPLISVNYSTPSHSVRQYFENYVDQSPKGYNYAKPPCTAQAPPGSVSVTTPSGRTYDIPVGKTASSSTRPYVAPGVTRKSPGTLSPAPEAPLAKANRPVYSVNSILPPLQPTPGPALGAGTYATSSQRVPAQPSTSQRPYVAPNLRNGASVSRPPPAVTVYHNEPPNFRTNIFGSGANKYNTARSRGLKY